MVCKLGYLEDENIKGIGSDFGGKISAKKWIWLKFLQVVDEEQIYPHTKSEVPKRSWSPDIEEIRTVLVSCGIL